MTKKILNLNTANHISLTKEDNDGSVVESKPKSNFMMAKMEILKDKKKLINEDIVLPFHTNTEVKFQNI